MDLSERYKKLTLPIINEILNYLPPTTVVRVDRKSSIAVAEQCRSPALERKRYVKDEPYICPQHPSVSPQYLLAQTKGPPCCMPAVIKDNSDLMSLYNFVTAENYFTNQSTHVCFIEATHISYAGKCVIVDLNKPKPLNEKILRIDVRTPDETFMWKKDHKTGHFVLDQSYNELDKLASDEPLTTDDNKSFLTTAISSRYQRAKIYDMAKRFNRQELIDDIEDKLGHSLEDDEKDYDDYNSDEDY